MPIIEDKVVINSPLAAVFSFVTNPDNWTEYVTSLTRVSDISSPVLEPGTTFRWEYRMLGIKFHGNGSVSENVLNRSFAMQMEGTMPVSEHYTFTPVGDATELGVRIEYQMPGKVLEKIANNSGLVEKLNKREAENVLAKIKLLCEEL